MPNTFVLFKFIFVKISLFYLTKIKTKINNEKYVYEKLAIKFYDPITWVEIKFVCLIKSALQDFCGSITYGYIC